MSLQPQITVLVPTYNHEEFVSAAIRSVVAQTIFAQCRLLVSDDVSSDRTVDIATREVARHSNARVVQNPSNLGVLAHYKTLAPKIDTPFVAILEGDDRWISENKLERQLALLENHPASPMCFCSYQVYHEETGVSMIAPTWRQERSGVVYFPDMGAENPVATFSNCLYRTETFKRHVAGVKSGYDWLINLRVAGTEGPLLFLDEPSTLYRVHSRGTWSGLSTDAKRDAIRETLLELKGVIGDLEWLWVESYLSRMPS